MRTMNLVGAAIVVLCAAVALPLEATSSAGVTCCETTAECPEEQLCCYRPVPCAPSARAYCMPIDNGCDIDTE